jgi:DNA-binding CsgD family transcriptional regulator
LVEGEPGIGKSALMSAAFADTQSHGCELLWGSADELSQRFPLRVMLECFGVDARALDPRRTEITALLRGDRPGGLLSGGDPVPAAVEQMLRFVDHLCAASPVVVVVDDLQWADESSLLVWYRLARLVEQLPLLMVGAYRPVPPRAEVEQLRRTVADGGGALVKLGPLGDEAISELVAELVGARPGVELRRLSAQAAGNPLYVGEMVHAVLSEQAVSISDGTAELDGSGFRAPVSLTSAVERRLGFLSAQVVDALRWAALLGQEFTVTDLAVVTGKPATELMRVVVEAMSAGVVADAGPRLAFRHPLIRRALYEATPRAMRLAVHRQAAQALAESGAAAERVAEQLLAAPASVDHWVVDWLADAAPSLATRAPLIAVELLERAVAHTSVEDDQRELLTAHLATIQFRLGRIDETEARAGQVLMHTRDPRRAAQMQWILGYVLYRSGRTEDAFTAVDQGLADASAPAVWAARLQALRSLILAGGRGDPIATEDAANRAVTMGEQAGDRFAVGHALSSLFFVHAASRDYAGALAVVDRALAVVGDDADFSDLRTILLDNRVFTLQNLDRLDDAEETLRAVREYAEQAGDAHRSRMHIAAGVHHYWVGRWDDALAELGVASEDLSEATNFGLRARWPMLLLHGAGALIAGHRDDRAAAQARLEAGLQLGLPTAGDRDNCDFLLAAEALVAEREGAPARALAVLAPILDPTFGQTLLRHQWLPDVVRLAIAVGDTTAARAAVDLCDAAAASEATPARAVAAAARCRGLLESDAAPLLSAAGHYRAVGRVVELAQTLEDAAVVLAQRDEIDGARAALVEAVELYGGLGADWDLLRAEVRVRPYGIRRSVLSTRRGRSHVAVSGWDALTPTELTVAGLVASGRSNPEIAVELFLSRRTVQSHVQHILTKLGAHSRVEIARQVLEAARLSGESA